MFTGTVEEIGTVTSVMRTASGGGDSARLEIRGDVVMKDLTIGDSVAVSGVCLTVARLSDGGFCADVMHETLRRTTLETVTIGTRVNLEPAATLHTRLGGHLMQGHVDGTGRILEREHTPQWDVVHIEIPGSLAKYVVSKGSIAVDGVSLTVVDSDDEGFTVSLIPTTLQRTILGGKAVAAPVNLEVDVMAKYAERLLAARAIESVGGVG